MPLPALSPPVHTRPGATSDAFLRAAQAMLQHKQVTPSRVANLVAIANREFHLVPHASQGDRAPVTELLRQLDIALEGVSALGSGTAARVLTLELTQLRERATTTCDQQKLEVKRAISAGDATRTQAAKSKLEGDGTVSPAPAAPNTFDKDSLAGWLTEALTTGPKPGKLTSFANNRFACTNVLASFKAPNVELEGHRSPGFVDLHTAQSELDAAHGVLARYNGPLTRAEIVAIDDELAAVERTVKLGIQICNRVLSSPAGGLLEGWNDLARSWLGRDVTTGEHAAPPVAPASATPSSPLPPPTAQETAHHTKPLVDLFAPHLESPHVPAGLIDELVSNAQQRYQYHEATSPPRHGEYEAMMRHLAGYVPLNAAKLEVEAAWDATEHMEDQGAKANVRRSLLEIGSGLRYADDYWRKSFHDKGCALIPGRRALALSWLGEAPPAVRRNLTEAALPAPKVETTVKLLSWPIVASDRAHGMLPANPEHEPSIDRLDRELQHLSEPFRAFVNAMFEEASQ